MIEYKIPIESNDYRTWSEFVTTRISSIMDDSIKSGNNKILIQTNLKRGLPLENINKVAGPFVEAWALERFECVVEEPNNLYQLINVEPGARLDPYDIILQFKNKDKIETFVSANVDVKATAEDIPTSGKSPNITSYARIRSEYLEDPDYIFIILSLKHKVYGEKDLKSGMTNGIMEVVFHSVYDLKYISDKDLNYNPALGTGQLQIRDIHYVDLTYRNTWEFCQVLDEKFKRSNGEEKWLEMAKKYKWIKV
jgi:hypothetical protein